MTDEGDETTVIVKCGESMRIFFGGEFGRRGGDCWEYGALVVVEVVSGEL